MAEGRVAPSPHTYTKVVLSAVLFVALLDLLFLGLGFVGVRAFRHLTVAALLAVLGALAWEPVARIKAGSRAPAIAWVLFPAAMLLALASLPFLAMSIYPPLEGMLFRVEARVSEATGTIEVSFPQPVQPDGVNLRFDRTEISNTDVRRNPQAFRWKTPQVLAIDMQHMLEVLAVRRPIALEINTVPGVTPFRYQSGEPVPEQRLALKNRD